MSQTYSHVVIGAGALGTGAAYWLSELGAESVLVLEQFELGHTMGASEDHSRIIRHSYHSPTYSELTHAMFEAWDQVEERTGVQLVLRTGGLDLVEEDSPQLEELNNYKRSLQHIGVQWEDLDAAEIRARWPQWQIEDNVIGMFQEDGGILDIRKANAAHLALAAQAGVTIRPRTKVTRIEPTADGVLIHTDGETISAGKVVVCAASWLTELMPGIGLDWKITLSQEQVSYFSTPNLRDFAPDRFPMWIWHGDPLFYGFPVYGEAAVKLGRDMTARFVTQETRSFEPDPAETELLRSFLAARIPGGVGPERYSRTCVYDMPADRDFILDHVPGQPHVVVGMGAGHGAKFGSLLGKILAQLTLHGASDYPIEAFRADRPALTDPTFEPVFRMVG
ncbi:N-methyl-L-tryptophan oxidase [Ornithinimicrobium cavernae]|uniref:N-methyl-L-tryptophan oxidase n=1 Tax=Ornithinimicrobium cavernae TaxID=2666047 RepID=UPI0013798D70|nr:N-methyl-L-tryptophan oxidase [Ornithinimicrobium cavernae]